MNQRQSVETHAVIWTEGKTDWKHLKNALAKLSIDLRVSFHETEDSMGGHDLLRRCKTLADTFHAVPVIFVFDRDDQKITKQIADSTEGYKSWGNNVFSFAIPTPKHRSECENVCIELYYSDDEIRTPDVNGRRIFLTSEFYESSGTHIEDSTIHIGNVHKLKGVTEQNRFKIVDSAVYQNNQNIALSKSDFVDYICSDTPPFNEFDFTHFQAIFDTIEEIIRVARPRTHLCMPAPEELFCDLETQEVEPEHFIDCFNTLIQVLEVTLQLFIAGAVGYYGREIAERNDSQEKQFREVRQVVSSKFTFPTLRTLSILARKCYHLVDEEAPIELRNMKELLGEKVVLGAIGELIDEWEELFRDVIRSRIVNKPEVAKDLIGYIIPEVVKYSSKDDDLFDAIEEGYSDLNISTWRDGALALTERLQPILMQEFLLESLDKVDPTNRIYMVRKSRYREDYVDVEHREIPFDSIDDYEDNISSVVMQHDNDQQVHIGLFPFLVIKDDKLFYYKRTKVRGYEYRSMHRGCVHLVQTKRRFNHTVFKTASKVAQQSLFWTEVVPALNEYNNIKANIPAATSERFVGRRKQIRSIRQEIIEIPNQNGIIYGLGGVGKTELMIYLSRELYEEEDLEKVLFDNIIWISAKSDYYEPSYDAIEERTQQFKSLDNIISTILDFFEFGNLDEYSEEDKRELLLEFLKEERILLVLDNFETIPEKDKLDITKFFDFDVKYRLKKKPYNFKVIITSRVQIPCGFHQIALEGLNLRESKQMMRSLFEQYRKGTSPELSDEQKKLLKEATFGIPILIKHCFGQIYRYNRPFDTVIRTLSTTPNKAVEFSFKETIDLLTADDCRMEIVLLLELMNTPLLIRQIADILAREESEIEDKLPELSQFQCVKKRNQGLLEKYAINDEIRILTRRLAQENIELAQDIRDRITENFTLEKQMDYSTEEVGILSLFDGYLAEGQYLEAERFLQDEIQSKPQATMLKFHYAKYIKEQKQDAEGAIGLLEEIVEFGNDHPYVLKLLLSCYMSLEIPDYERAHIYVQQLESLQLEDENLRQQVGEFYIRWSIQIKMNRDFNPDPIEEMLRQQKYKDLAQKGLDVLERIKGRTHEIYYYLAQGYFNLWDYETASNMISKAIQMCDQDPRYYHSYNYLRGLIFRQEEKYSTHQEEY